MATVYLARDLKHDRAVALKVLHPELAATLGPERFQREIRSPLACSTPISFRSSTRARPGSGLLPMPFVEGESLRARLSAAAAPGRRPADHARGCDAPRLCAQPRYCPPRHQARKHPVLRDQALVADFGVARH